MTNTYQHYREMIDEIYFEALQSTHRGKDIEQAIKESFLHLIADPVRLERTEPADFKRLVNGWLTNKRFPKTAQGKKLIKLDNL